MKTAKFPLIVLPLLLLVAASAGFAEGQKTSPRKPNAITKQEVQKADAAFNRAIVGGNAKALEGLLADRLSWVARGRRLGKAQVLADVKNRNFYFKSLHHDQIRIEIFGNTAVETGHSTSVLVYRGKLYATPRLFTSVYMKLDGRVQLVAHEVSLLTSK